MAGCLDKCTCPDWEIWNVVKERRNFIASVTGDALVRIMHFQRNIQYSGTAGYEYKCEAVGDAPLCFCHCGHYSLVLFGLSTDVSVLPLNTVFANNSSV